MTINGTIDAKINQEFFDYMLSILNTNLTSNPKFMEAFTRELKYVVYKTHSDDFNIYTSPNGDSVTIMSTKPMADCAIKDFNGANSSFINIVIRLNGDDLYDEYSQGVIFDRKKVEESGIRTLAHYETKLETTYFLSCYTKDGIEFSNSSFSDNYPLKVKTKEVDLRDQVLSSFHKPVFMENSLPKAPIHILKAKARNTYRKKDNLSVIHTNMATMTANGYEDVLCSLHAVHPLYPDLLRGSSLIAKSIEQDGKFIFIADETYAKTVEEGFAKARKEALQNLEQSKESINETVYKGLINNI
jgi:hypothetical protein